MQDTNLQVFTHLESNITLTLLAKIIQYERLKIGLSHEQLIKIIHASIDQAPANNKNLFPTFELLVAAITVLDITNWQSRCNLFWSEGQLNAHVVAENIRQKPEWGTQLILSGTTTTDALQKSFDINLEELITRPLLTEQEADPATVERMIQKLPTPAAKRLGRQLRATIFKKARLQKGLAPQELVKFLICYKSREDCSQVSTMPLEEYLAFEKGIKCLRYNYLVSGVRFLNITDWNERYSPIWNTEKLTAQLALEGADD